MSKFNNQEWLQKWLDGDLTRTEEKELRKIAQQEPFLADALAGLESNPTVDHQAHLASIKRRLAERAPRSAKVRQLNPPPEQTEAKVVPLGGLDWRRIAAAVALLLIAAGGMWYIGQSDQMTQNMAVQNDQATYREVNPTKDNTEVDRVAAVENEIPTKEPIAAAEPLPDKRTSRNTSATSPKTKESNSAARSQQRRTEPAATTPTPATTPAPSVPLEVEPAPRIAPEPYAATQGRIVTEPVEEGVVNPSGYEEQVVIPVEDDASVVAESARKLSKNRMATSQARPAMGFAKFEEFIKKNLVVDEYHGRLRWVFQLDAEGSPINVRIVESPTNGLSQQARPLFKNGGKWIAESQDDKAIYEYEYKF